MTLTALAAVKNHLRQLEDEGRKQAVSCRGVVVDVAPEANVCPLCGGPTRVQKTAAHRVATLEHGAFEAKETILVCVHGCTNASGHLATVRSQELRRRVRSGAVFGYDLEVRVGLERYVYHRQRLEIQASLEAEGIVISTGQISVLATRFLDHFERLHWQRAPRIRAAMESFGGYVLHTDATGEDGRGTLFVAYDGWTGWVLGSWKLSTERSELILPCLRKTAQAFGTPRAIMRDLGRAEIKAAQDLKSELKADFPILGCHRHFLSDIGNDLLEKTHDQLREMVRKFGLTTELRRLARELGLRLGPLLPQLRVDIKEWSESEAEYTLPDGSKGLAIVRAMAQFAVDYEQDSKYGSFPYDRPYLDFYRRCLIVRRSVDAYLRTPNQNADNFRTLERLARILDPVVSQAAFATIIEKLTRRAALFDELRDALRLTPRVENATPAKGAVKPPLESAVAELNDIKKAVESLTESLRQRRPQRGPAQDQRRAIDLIIDHLERHGDSLWGHVITLPNGAVRIASRTNNILEGFFRSMKQGERRRCGRKNLAQDFESLPAAAALARNLTDPKYVHMLCGSLDELSRAFAELDAAGKNDTSKSQSHTKIPAEAGVTSASLPRIDRPTVRLPAFRRNLERAARSRAPRYNPL